jgi:hypothetical protein
MAVIKHYASKKEELQAKLHDVLWQKHGDQYTIWDVALSETPGYLYALKLCPMAGKHWYCSSNPHYHSIGIEAEVYGYKDAKGHFVSPFKFWKELRDEGVLKVMTREEWELQSNRARLTYEEERLKEMEEAVWKQRDKLESLRRCFELEGRV